MRDCVNRRNLISERELKWKGLCHTLSVGKLCREVVHKLATPDDTDDEGEVMTMLAKGMKVNCESYSKPQKETTWPCDVLMAGMRRERTNKK